MRSSLKPCLKSYKRPSESLSITNFNLIFSLVLNQGIILVISRSVTITCLYTYSCTVSLISYYNLQVTLYLFEVPTNVEESGARLDTGYSRTL